MAANDEILGFKGLENIRQLHQVDVAVAHQARLGDGIAVLCKPRRLNHQNELEMGQAERREDAGDLALMAMGDAPQEESDRILGLYTLEAANSLVKAVDVALITFLFLLHHGSCG